MSKRKLLSGNDACVLGALAAGMKFYAGYPITPATEIAEKCSVLMPAHGGTFVQMEDELGSICAVIGASLAGVNSMTATSGPGFSLMQEAIGYAAMTEVPCVIIDVMRLGPGTGAPTLIAQGDIMQSIFGSHGDYPSVVLSPNSVEELYTETIRAFSLANQLSTPVTVISDAWLAHMSELIDLDIPYEIAPRKTSPQNADDYRPYFNDGTGIPAAPAFGSDKRWKSTGLIHDESGFPHPNDHELVAENIRRINKKLDDNIAIIQSWEERFTDEDYGVLVVSIGSASRCVRSAEKLREQGIKVAFFRPITLWPFPAKRFNELAANAKNIVCCEMSAGQLEFLCRANADHGTKITGLRQNNGCLLSEETIISGIKEIVLNER